MALLAALGPQALARDPGLALRLRHEVGRLPALAEPQRRLLGATIAPLEAGPAQGSGGGADRAGLANRGPITALLHSQFALDRDLLMHRHRNGGLLYRAHTGREPPRLRPTVILLDTGPACYGPVEAITRPAAIALATTLARQGVSAVLLGTGPRQLQLLDSAQARLRILTERTLEPADPHACLAQARALLLGLDGGPVEPMVLLLTHCFFAAEAQGLPAVRGLRALFVRYPRRPLRSPDEAQRNPGAALQTLEVSAARGGDLDSAALHPGYDGTDRSPPAFAAQCERWAAIGAGDFARIPAVLGRLIG